MYEGLVKIGKGPRLKCKCGGRMAIIQYNERFEKKYPGSWDRWVNAMAHDCETRAFIRELIKERGILPNPRVN